ncbi:MAG: HPr family phosphocarrier protein [Verrucomicrobiaceae bacterium]|nr:HPr family phosphocarrier protein [Verrucomicrobiaceae bacterium]
MLEKELTIINKNGMHARPAAQFVKLTSTFKSEVWVEKDDEQVNGKSIMGLMMLAAAKGEKIKVSVQGPDSDAAMAAIENLVATGFGDVE